MRTRLGVRPPATDPRRQELLIQLLRLAADPHAYGAAWEGIAGTGQAIPIRPHEPRCQLTNNDSHTTTCTCWLRSLDELHRCLRTMRNQQRPLWYAITERYVLADRRPRLVHFKNRRPQLEPNQELFAGVTASALDLNRRGDGYARLQVETWRPGISKQRVQLGLAWLSAEFKQPLELPVFKDRERSAA
jgi:hypothetical protein